MLLACVRHTNAPVTGDRGFPFWAQIETINILLMDDVPVVLPVPAGMRPNCDPRFQINLVFNQQQFQLEAKVGTGLKSYTVALE